MKKFTLMLTLFLSTLLWAQEDSMNFEQTFEKAQQENKGVILVFSGSDWCVPCMKLKKNILDTPAFQEATKDEYLMVHADFPQKKKNKDLQPTEVQKQNKMLAEKYNPKGYFPLVVVFDKDQKVKGVLQYEEVSPEEFSKRIDQLFN